MASPRKKSSIVVARSRKTIALPPSTLGFASFVEPDTFDEDKPQFKGNFHFTPEAIESLAAQLDQYAIEANAEKLAEEMAANDLTAKKDAESGHDWLEAKLKEPKEGARITLPFLTVAVKANAKTKSGEEYQREIVAWDANNKKLDMKELRLGMGSIVQAIVYPNLVFRKIDGYARPSLQLVGVRVLKLVQWGGSDSRAPGQVDEKELAAVLGSDFQADDLSQFAGQAKPAKGNDQSNDGDLDPEDAVDDMF